MDFIIYVFENGFRRVILRIVVEEMKWIVF